MIGRETTSAEYAAGWPANHGKKSTLGGKDVATLPAASPCAGRVGHGAAHDMVPLLADTAWLR